jgi:4-hydroxybenzoate polyprenyltransferase
MQRLKRIGKIAQALSLDVVLGAICCSAMFCRLMKITPLPWGQLAVLGGTVLLIYTTDHQSDVHKMKGLPLTDRHRFHWRNRRLLRPFAAGLLLLLAVTSLWLPRVVLLYGLGLAATVGAYLLAVSRLPSAKAGKWFHKEILIAVLYTAGVWGSVAVRAAAPGRFAWLSGAIFGLLALQNLMLFSYLEWEEDVSQGQRSVARSWGKTGVRGGLLILAALLAGLLLAGWWWTDGSTGRAVWITMALMALVLGVLSAFPAPFRQHALYRWLGDGVFLLAAWALFR